MLQLQPHMDEWREMGFDLIFVTLSPDESIERFLRERDVEGDFYFDPEAGMHDAYSVRAVPTTFIVDTRGEIREVTLGWDASSVQKMKDWVDELAPGS